MPRICAHCRHVRKDDEVAPEWQCPACERAYVKAGDSMPNSGYGATPIPIHRGRTSGGRGKWLLLLAILGVGIWFAKPMWRDANNQTTEVANFNQPEVVLYATSWCSYCEATRSFFQENQIKFTEYDIENSSFGKDEHRRLGGNGVPLVVIGDQVIHGYNEASMRESLRPWLKGS
jgi:glutaredoxin